MARIAVYLLLSTTAVLATCLPLTAQNWRPVSMLQQDNGLGQPAPFPDINGTQSNNGQSTGSATQGNGAQEFAPPLVAPPAGGYLPGPYGNGNCCPDPCCGDMWSHGQPSWCGGDCCSSSCRKWYTSADALWLNRNDSSRRNLTTQSGRILLTTDDLDHDHASGARITLGHFLDDCTSLEGSYFGFFDWSSQKSVHSIGQSGLMPYWDAYDEGPYQGFNNAAVHSADYSTQLINAELGIRHWVNPDASLLFGVRYLSIDEDFDFYSVRSGAGTSFYSVHTDNELVGLQIGGDWSKPCICNRVRFTLAGKAGLFANFAQQSNEIFNTVSNSASYPGWRNSSSNETSLSSVLEISATFSLQVTDHLALRAGYQHFFITGLALATDHLDGNPDHVNAGQFMSTEGSLHLSGPFVGGELILP